MVQLRFGAWMTVLALLGCDNGRGNPDSGLRLLDSGTDSGSAMMDAGTDSGPVRRCGPEGECDIGTASSCGSGRGCMMIGSSTAGFMTQCFTAGAGTDGTPCTPMTAGECAEGFVCSDSESVCRKWCCSDEDCLGTELQLCLAFSNANGAGICTPPSGCILAPQSGCEVGDGCYPIRAGQTGCAAAGTKNAGDACTATNECAAGSGCIGPEGSGVCRQFCGTGITAGEPGSCPTGTCMTVTGFPSGFGACLP